MNILIFSEPSYPKHPGGAGKCSHIMAAGLVERGHTVYIVSQADGDREIEQIDGVNVHRLKITIPDSIPKQKSEAYEAEEIFSYLQKEVPLSSIDIIHDSGGFLSYFFPLEYKLCLRYRVPLVLHFRYILLKNHAALAHQWKYHPFSYFLLRLESAIYYTTQCFPVRIADLVICLSDEDKNIVNSIFKPEPDRITVVPDPVDTRFYSPGEGQKVRKELAKPGEKLVLFAGRIEGELKGSNIVLRAFKKMLAVRPGLRLLLLARETKAFTPFVRKFGPAVTPLGWVQDAGKLAGIFSAADLVLMPSRFESFGMVCAEAMAAGTPVVASPVGGIRDMIDHGKNGFLFSNTNPKSWERELVKYSLDVLSDPVLAVKIGKNAEKYARENFSIEKIALRIEQLYYDVLWKKKQRDRMLIRPPQITGIDEERYLAFLNKKIGPAAGEAGSTGLTRWQSSIDQRCPSCKHARLAANIRRLLCLKPFGIKGLWYKIAGTFKKKVRLAVEETCPMELLQKDFVRGSSRSHGGV